MSAVRTVLTLESTMAFMACRKRAGAQPHRQVARFLQRLGAELDLAVRADLAVDHRRLPLHPPVEDDRHVIVDVPCRFIRELAGPTMAELERDDRLIGHRIA